MSLWDQCFRDDVLRPLETLCSTTGHKTDCSPLACLWAILKAAEQKAAVLPRPPNQATAGWKTQGLATQNAALQETRFLKCEQWALHSHGKLLHWCSDFTAFLTSHVCCVVIKKWLCSIYRTLRRTCLLNSFLAILSCWSHWVWDQWTTVGVWLCLLNVFLCILDWPAHCGREYFQPNATGRILSGAEAKP